MADLAIVSPLAERMDAEGPFFVAQEVADYLHISKEAVHLAERSGELRSVRFGRAVRFPRRAVLDWIERKSAAHNR